MALQATVAEIDLDAFTENVRKIKSLVGTSKCCVVVKANAYGHGMIAISNAAIRAGAKSLAVATVNEGCMLREAGIGVPIFVLFQHLRAEAELVCHYGLTPIITNDSSISAYEEYCKRHKTKMSVHLKIDTGLNRMGVPVHDVLEFARKVLSHDHIKIDGVSTHLASADGDDDASVAFTQKQISRFEDALTFLWANGIETKNIHAANSAASISHPSGYFNMVRFGISAYGYSPNKDNNPGLIPVMSLKSRVLVTKKIHKGDSVSYGMTWTADKDTSIAVIPVGYADGFSRLFSNRGMVKIAGNYYEIIGRVCMDQIIVDTKNDNIALEEEVLLFGRDEVLNAGTLASQIGTIPYEILTSISSRVERIYKSKNHN